MQRLQDKGSCWPGIRTLCLSLFFVGCKLAAHNNRRNVGAREGSKGAVTRQTAHHSRPPLPSSNRGVARPFISQQLVGNAENTRTHSNHIKLHGWCQSHSQIPLARSNTMRGITSSPSQNARAKSVCWKRLVSKGSTSIAIRRIMPVAVRNICLSCSIPSFT
jgi:hypothetical protein